MNALYQHIWESNLSYAMAATLSGIDRSRITRLASGRVEPTQAERVALSTAFPDLQWSDNPYAGLPRLDQVRQRLADFLLSREGELIVRRILQVVAPSP